MQCSCTCGDVITDQSHDLPYLTRCFSAEDTDPAPAYRRPHVAAFIRGARTCGHSRVVACDRASPPLPELHRPPFTPAGRLHTAAACASNLIHGRTMCARNTHGRIWMQGRTQQRRDRGESASSISTRSGALPAPDHGLAPHARYLPSIGWYVYRRRSRVGEQPRMTGVLGTRTVKQQEEKVYAVHP
jgi:hypothetical protein